MTACLLFIAKPEDSHGIQEQLLIRALMFRQDYRINKIFLPFQKKGKKHHLHLEAVK